MKKYHLPCNDCGSSDALACYEDHTYCFACGTYKQLNGSSSFLVSPFIEKEFDVVNDFSNQFTEQLLDWRGITKDTFKAYGCIFRVSSNGSPYSVVFPYGDGATKERLIDSKNFYAKGAMNQASLFGMERFSKGSAKAITITEGELDALSAYQMLGSKYPVVSVRSSTSARVDCERARDFLNSFDRIYLCFDNDEAGTKAVAEVAKLFDISKVYYVEMTKYKDANEFLANKAEKEFNNIWWNSKPFLPKGIITTYDDVENVLRSQQAKSLASFPFPTLDAMTYGIQNKDIILVTAMEGVGKTEVLRAIEHHLLKTTDENIGVIHLEEDERRSIQGLVGYELQAPVHLPDANVSVEDQVETFKKLTKREGRLHFFSHFGSDDPNAILEIIRYLVTVCKCKFVFLDHITMLVTGFEGDDERKKLDYISTRLGMLVHELDFSLCFVSHVNDDGKTRGSRNISKIAKVVLHLNRNTEAATFEERAKTQLLVKKNRFGAHTGPAGYLTFDPKTFTLKEVTIEDGENSQATFSPGF